jgi:hypothetical protein
MTIKLEAVVTINGRTLTNAEVSTLRCAVSSFIMTINEPDALGNDEHGRFMRASYLVHGRAVERMLVEGYKA